MMTTDFLIIENIFLRCLIISLLNERTRVGLTSALSNIHVTKLIQRNYTITLWKYPRFFACVYDLCPDIKVHRHHFKISCQEGVIKVC